MLSIYPIQTLQKLCTSGQSFPDDVSLNREISYEFFLLWPSRRPSVVVHTHTQWPYIFIFISETYISSLIPCAVLWRKEQADWVWRCVVTASFGRLVAEDNGIVGSDADFVQAGCRRLFDADAARFVQRAPRTSVFRVVADTVDARQHRRPVHHLCLESGGMNKKPKLIVTWTRLGKFEALWPGVVFWTGLQAKSAVKAKEFQQ